MSLLHISSITIKLSCGILFIYYVHETSREMHDVTMT